MHASQSWALDEVALLDLWDRAARLGREKRAAALLSAGGPEPTLTPDQIADLPVGRRDDLLLRRCADTFGDRLDALAGCPACGSTVEFELSCAALLAGPGGTISAGAAQAGVSSGGVGSGADAQPVRELVADGYSVRWRLPTGRDLEAAAGAGGLGAGVRTLLGRCILDAEHAGTAVAVLDLPDAVRGAVADCMAEADTLADVTVALSCPECAASWESGLDVCGFVWAKVGERAERLLREVHVLARAYGWTEQEVLALTPERRSAYLELVGDG